MSEELGLLVVPRIRVQNANAISSALTWGFPSITAFTGLTTALHRRVGSEVGLRFYGVGVICHTHQVQATSDHYKRMFHLSRNPIKSDGSTAGISEEGRIHLDLSLVFEVGQPSGSLPTTSPSARAARVREELEKMRVAGGSVVPTKLSTPSSLTFLGDLTSDAEKTFRQIMRGLPPGFALVGRDDLLATRLRDLQATSPTADAFDAWLDFGRLTQRATTDSEGRVVWSTDRRRGWIVPIPVGFAQISKLFPPGAIADTRDAETPACFVEPVWSLGEWKSVYRLRSPEWLFWRTEVDESKGSDWALYRAKNSYGEQTNEGNDHEQG